MKYICVEWFHDFSNEPVKIYSEIDDERYEIRKVELFKDGTCGYAYKNIEIGKTGLGKIPFPEDLNEINDNPEFKAMEITKDDFEKVWNKSQDK